MGDALDYILKKLPDHSATIIDFYNKDEDFKVLCQDYHTSARALEQYRLNELKDRELEGEFLQVYVDLEKEILHLLAKDSPAI